MNIIVIGTGYVGLIQGLILAEKCKTKVLFIESDERKIRALRDDRESPFFEPGLPALLNKNYKRLDFDSQIRSSHIKGETIVFICVGTPQDGDGKADLRYIDLASKQIAEAAKSATYRSLTVVVKSTVPPGTTRNLVAPKFGTSKNAYVAMNPEFLREGCAVVDGLKPDRIIVGAEDPVAFKILRKVYLPFKTATWIACSTTEAEMAKYTMNSLLAILISFSNEISQITSRLKGVSPHRVLEYAKHDGRWLVGKKRPSIASYLVPGPGFGGSCFPKDVSAIAQVARGLGLNLPLIEGIMKTNETMAKQVTDEILRLRPGGGTITILGLAFKPDTDDVRESPTLRILKNLDPKYKVRIHDPIAALPEGTFTRIQLERNLSSALSGSDLAVLVTSWSEYKKITDKSLATMKQASILDTRGLLTSTKFKKSEYHLLGYSL